MDLRNLLLRIAFGSFGAVLSLLICLAPLPWRLGNLQRRTFDRFFLAAFALSRVLVFFLVFFLLHQKPHADLVAFYVPQAREVLHGLVPYRDFQSSYAPLNPYLDALLLRIRNSPLSIVVFQIVCDIASIPFWVGFLRRFMPEGALRRSAFLYLVQPIVLWGTAIDGKNQACISLLLAISLFTLAKREVISGISYSLSLTFVKILPLMFFPALFLGSRNRTRWVLSALLLTLLVYMGFALGGANVTVPIHAEGSIATSGNLPYFVSYLWGCPVPAALSNIVALLAVAAAVGIATHAQMRVSSDAERARAASDGILFVLITVLLMTKKSDPIYLTMCLFLLCAFTVLKVEAGSRLSAYAYAVLIFLALPISSFYYWPLGSLDGPRLHAMLLSLRGSAWIMAIVQPLLLACYVLFAVQIYQELRLVSHGYANRPQPGR